MTDFHSGTGGTVRCGRVTIPVRGWSMPRPKASDLAFVEFDELFPPYESDPEYSALTAAVDATPGDDLPELVRADWIEERGDSGRANAIRRRVGSRRAFMDLIKGLRKTIKNAGVQVTQAVAAMAPAFQSLHDAMMREWTVVHQSPTRVRRHRERVARHFKRMRR